MKYTDDEVLDIIKLCTTEDASEILKKWNTTKANTQLDLTKWNYPYYVYTFPVILDGVNIADITVVDLYSINQKDDLIHKYLGHDDYEKTYWTFSHYSYLNCYIVVHKEFTLPKIPGFRAKEFTSKDADGNEFTFAITVGNPEKEDDLNCFHQYDYTPMNIERNEFDFSGFRILIDKDIKGWNLGDKINENIKNRLEQK